MIPLEPGPGLTERAVRLPDGRSLRTVQAGSRSPLVVFEAGLSAAAGSWVAVQRLVAQHARTISYDRFGHGGSDESPRAPTLAQMTADLSGLLEALAESDAVVLVGHSWGGVVLRTFAAEHPARVAGLVLVDATVTAVMNPRQAKATATGFAVLAKAASVGLARPLLSKVSPCVPGSDATQEDMKIFSRDYGSRRSLRTGAREAAEILTSLPSMRALEQRGLPDVPVAIVVGGRVDRATKALRPVLIAQAEREMADHPQGRAVVVEGAGHLVPQEYPVEVALAVLDVVDSVRLPTEGDGGQAAPRSARS